MKTAVYTYKNDAGVIYRCRINFYSVADEPYSPGGMLRVMRDIEGRIIQGPHIDDILEWHVDGAA